MRTPWDHDSYSLLGLDCKGNELFLPVTFQLTMLASMLELTHSNCLRATIFSPRHLRNSRSFRVMASGQSGNGVTGTSKGHEQASGIGQKVQDFAQKAVGAAGATVDKTVSDQMSVPSPVELFNSIPIWRFVSLCHVDKWWDAA